MNETTVINPPEVAKAFERVAAALETHHDDMTKLDQAMGDGDLGVTALKISAALKAHAAETSMDDVGKYLVSAAMALNRAASSTMGTLLSSGLLRAGKEIGGCKNLHAKELASMLEAADHGIQERGKAKPGDKTVVDALHPAAKAFRKAIEDDLSLKQAGNNMLAAAEAGLEVVTPLQSRIGRASWVGERTKNLVDPGCALLVVILRAILDQ